MNVTNHTKGLVLANMAEVAGTWPSRLRGLLFRDSLPEGRCLILDPCNSVHTCFMKFHIDVIFVSQAGTVIHLIENMPPFRFSSIVRGSRYVIELPAHTIEFTGTSLNDRVSTMAEILER